MLTQPIPSLSHIAELKTARLHLRPWQASDHAPFAALNADPEVMRYFPATLDSAASAAFIHNTHQHFARYGWGLWAVEILHGPDAGDFIGFVGLSVPKRQFAFSPCVEIGWRLAQRYWRRGYASEAARTVLEFGFKELDLAEIVSFTSVLNVPSRAVMEKIGLHNQQQDFDHPALPDGHALQRHCLYALQKSAWLTLA
ncbi:MAG: GNAT family N-acetyltransferase [Burkholderiales bacterium]|nr:GNAT family N-acetyltransferase [Burkholderiales bacterium]